MITDCFAQLSVVVNEGVSVKWTSMLPVSGCPSAFCTGWEGLMGVAYIRYYKHNPMYMVMTGTHTYVYTLQLL